MTTKQSCHELSKGYGHFYRTTSWQAVGAQNWGNISFSFLRTLPRICTRTDTVPFTRCFAPVIPWVLLAQREDKGRSTLAVSQQDPAQSDTSSAHYLPSLLCTFTTSVQKAAFLAWKSICFTGLCWRTSSIFFLQKHEPKLKFPFISYLLKPFHISSAFACTWMCWFPAKESAAQECSLCQRLSMPQHSLWHDWKLLLLYFNVSFCLESCYV